MHFVNGALDNLVVLDLTRVLAGPFCTQMLSDLGATVWKIEPPWGEDTRQWGPPFLAGESAYFLSANRGKKSVAVNLKEERGQDLVKGLARQADVLVENHRPGGLARYGLDYESLSGLNPRLIYASITGFGQTGPRAHQPGYDATIQAMTGVMSVTGEAGAPPTRVGVAWIDILTGLHAVIGIQAALRERDASGEGQRIDLSLFDVGVASMVNVAQRHLLTGEGSARMGTAHPQIVPYQMFMTRDGWLVVAVGNDEQYRRMTEAISHPELWADERFRTNAGRVEHRDELVPRLSKILEGRPRDEWLERLEKLNVPSAPVYDVTEVFKDPQADHRNVRWEVEHPLLGAIPQIASPFQHMSGTPAQPRSHPPLLGEHTRAVLGEALGLDESDLDTLAAEGVILQSSSHPSAHGGPRADQ